jgi:RNA polymerase sigma-70 factor, ECF subfamily
MSSTTLEMGAGSYSPDPPPLAMVEEPAIAPDRDLIVRLKNRDPQAMVDLYDRFGKLVYSIIFRAVNNGPTAEDLTQETFLRVGNRIHTFSEEKGKLEAWLVTVARNRAFDYLRASQSSLPVASGNLDEFERAGWFASTESPADRIAREKAVRNALKGLNKDQRQVIELTHFEGMTQTEIAEKLRKPLGTVKGLTRSALKSLRAAMIGSSVQ